MPPTSCWATSPSTQGWIWPDGAQSPLIPSSGILTKYLLTKLPHRFDRRSTFCKEQNMGRRFLVAALFLRSCGSLTLILRPRQPGDETPQSSISSDGALSHAHADNSTGPLVSDPFVKILIFGAEWPLRG